MDFSDENEFTEEVRDNPLSADVEAAPVPSEPERTELLGRTRELADCGAP